MSLLLGTEKMAFFDGVALLSQADDTPGVQRGAQSLFSSLLAGGGVFLLLYGSFVRLSVRVHIQSV